jgi:hypothetical protein
MRFCERSVGTVSQLTNPDAIYSRDEGNERRWWLSLVVRFRARSTHCRGKVFNRVEVGRTGWPFDAVDPVFQMESFHCI